MYNEENGSTVTCYTGDYINVGKILPENEQYGQMTPLIVSLLSLHFINKGRASGRFALLGHEVWPGVRKCGPDGTP